MRKRTVQDPCADSPNIGRSSSWRTQNKQRRNVHSLLAAAVRSFRITCRSIFRFCSRSLNEFRLLLTAWISRHASDDIGNGRSFFNTDDRAARKRRARIRSIDDSATPVSTSRARLLSAADGRDPRKPRGRTAERRRNVEFRIVVLGRVITKPEK